MSLDHSITEIVNRLVGWSRFPKYALERRLDIFLTPFLEGFVEGAFKKAGSTTVTAKLAAPEFPLLARIDPERRPPKRESKEPSALTVNVDYLLYVVVDGEPRWLFFELKTDRGSFKKEQLRLYRVARDRTMPRLLTDLQSVRGRTAKADKYLHLQKTLETGFDCSAPIQLAYLSPEPKDGFPTEKTTAGALPTIFWSFDTFRAHRPTQHPELWKALQPLLER
jgi:hypothetical protein